MSSIKTSVHEEYNCSTINLICHRGQSDLSLSYLNDSKQLTARDREDLFGLSRAIGETMAVTMLIGNSNKIPGSIFDPANTMSSIIANEFAEAVTVLHSQALVVQLNAEGGESGEHTGFQ